MVNPLLSLIQLSDSAFPIGAYSHSYGFEALIEKGAIKNSIDAAEAIQLILQMTIAPQDGVACALAHAYAASDDDKALRTLQSYLTAMKWPREIQQASIELGERLKRIARELDWCELFPEINHHAIVFGYLCQKLNVSAEESVSTYLLTAATSVASACVRLVPLGHTDGQRIISQCAKVISSVTQDCLQSKLEDLSSFAPFHEKACVDHEQQYTRIFQS